MMIMLLIIKILHMIHVKAIIMKKNISRHEIYKI
jgi:hypothetical protein